MVLTEYKSNILYTEYSAVKQLCSPLEKLGIVGFFYMRHYPDGTFLDLSNQLEWSDYFLENLFQCRYDKAMVSEHLQAPSSTVLWSLSPMNKIWKDGIALFNFGNGITVNVERPKYRESFSFYSDANNNSINNFYISHLDILMRFINYFRDKTVETIEKNQKNRFTVPDYYLNDLQKTRSDKKLLNDINVFHTELGCTQQQADISYHPVITTKELDCIRHAVRGIPVKVIADNLGVSPRTVESHLNSAKSKMRAKNICELVYKASQYYFLG